MDNNQHAALKWINYMNSELDLANEVYDLSYW